MVSEIFRIPEHRLPKTARQNHLPKAPLDQELARIRDPPPCVACSAYAQQSSAGRSLTRTGSHSRPGGWWLVTATGKKRIRMPNELDAKCALRAPLWLFLLNKPELEWSTGRKLRERKEDAFGPDELMMNRQRVVGWLQCRSCSVLVVVMDVHIVGLASSLELSCCRLQDVTAGLSVASGNTSR